MTNPNSNRLLNIQFSPWSEHSTNRISHLFYKNQNINGLAYFPYKLILPARTTWG